MKLDIQPIWQRYKPTLLQDVLAGITGAIAGAPQAMGFAIIAGVSPLYGLYTATTVTIVGALTTRSQFMTVAPTNALALVVGSTFLFGDAQHPIERLFVLTLLVGVFQLGFALFRVDYLVRFVSNAVMTGFITGAGLLIILGQLRHLTGYEGGVSGGILVRFWDWLRHLNQSDPQTFVIGIIATVIIWTLHHTRYRSVATLTAIIVTTLLVILAGWDHVAQVRDMSVIQSGLPGLVFPDLRYVPSLLAPALALAVLASVQGAALSNSVGENDGSSAVARDIAGQGIANLVAGLFQGMPSGASLSRTAVNIAAGARTRLANIIAGMLVGVILIVFGSIVEQITLAALAGHLIVAATTLINLHEVHIVWRVSRSARLVMAITFISTLTLPLEYSIYIGVVLSLALYVYTSSSMIKFVQLVRTEDGHFREEPVPERLPSGKPIILSISGNLYFAAVRRVEEMMPIPEGAKCPVVIIRLRDNRFLGTTGLHFLERYAQRVQMQGGRLMIVGVEEQLREQLKVSGGLESLGPENIFYADNVLFSATEAALDDAKTWLFIHYE